MVPEAKNGLRIPHVADALLRRKDAQTATGSPASACVGSDAVAMSLPFSRKRMGSALRRGA